MDQQTIGYREITPGARVAPPADWVDLAPYTIPQTANPHFIAQGVCVLLDDSQIDLLGEDRSWYYRRAELVTAPAGAERVAQFSVNFDPAFERVDVHSIAVIRGGQRIKHTANAAFEVLRRERNMERLQFDGRLTVHFTIPDVRQGDVVETAYTLFGQRKSLLGKHGAFIGLEWGVGIVEVRLRQRTPKDRVVLERAFNSAPAGEQTEADGIIDRRWRMMERRGIRGEALTPPWTIQTAALQLSEWRDWADVAEAFTRLYAHEGPLPDEVEQEIARIQATEPTPEGRAAAVLRFAQSAVRYLAISMGEGGYTPRSLADVCSARYGDCKDKSKLFTQMALRLGLDACPALVNTFDGYALDERLPSAQMFDHCVVRLAIGKKVYWLDATRQVQASPLDKVTQCYFGWALPMRAGVNALERMPDPNLPHLVEAYESVQLRAFDEPVRYEWKTIYRDARAEAIREQFAREGAVSVFQSYAEDVQRTWPKAQVVSQDILEDDVANNVFTVREVYDIHDAWTPAGPAAHNFATRDLAIAGSLMPLDPGDRKHPIYLGQPGKRTRRVEVRTMKSHEGGWLREQRASTLAHSDEMKVKDGGKLLVIEQSLDIKALTLPAKEAEAYRKVVANLSNNELVVTETDLKAGNKISVWTLIGWLAAGAFILYSFVRGQ
jgi:hypothetical protein